MYLKRLIILLLLCVLIHQLTFAQQADFSHAVIFSPSQDNVQLQEAVAVLKKVVEEHSNIHLPVVHEAIVRNKPLIVVCTARQKITLPKDFDTILNKLSPTGKDGYKVTFLKDKNMLLVEGYDER